MRHEDIEKAFANFWRIKGFDSEKACPLSGRAVKLLCLDFFRTGILLAEGSVSCDTIATKAPFTPHTEVHVSDLLPDGSMTPLKEVDPFDYWWKMYDLKVGKEKCKKKWETLTELEKAECIAATPAYVHSTPDKQFRKRPLTYLNGKCWNDEIINSYGTDKQQQSRQRIAEAARTFAKYAAPSGGDTE